MVVVEGGGYAFGVVFVVDYWFRVFSEGGRFILDF